MIGAHFFGVVGMAGVWLVPSRFWELFVVRRVGLPLNRNARSASLAIMVFTAILFSLFVALETLPRVFRCLWEGWCTSTRGGGLLNLAVFGVTVLMVEATWLACSALARRWHSNAT